MWTKTYEKSYENVTKKDVWQTMIDVNHWHQWHDDLEYCKIEGPFEVGNFFMLKPYKMKAVKIHLIAVKPFKSFTDCTHFFGAKMYDTHTLYETENGVILKNTFTIKGPLWWLWFHLVVKDVAASIPSEMDALIHFIKQKT